MRRRLSDQILVLQAIDKTRDELVEANASGKGWIAITEIMGRLVDLYACLDVKRLSVVAVQADVRERLHGKVQRVRHRG